MRVSCPTSSWYFRARRIRQYEARPAVHIENIDKGRNEVVANSECSRRAGPTRHLAALRPLAMGLDWAAPPFPAVRALPDAL